ncbi:hypothetical protein SCNRRL3882_1173 [Streptomyces chartreusis NRRL 3882]|uniref:Uncharacterized protein n=1 Tax=Streptomyces chartreusis NRRL 3882 TaxID=1079985 RepID=A0A2N9B2Y1_STRCX|nr:hypothetical protein SCNRRL3882_1173 [Streptomyces chartreusis NRRL 3882]
MRDHEDTVEIDDDLAVCVRGVLAGRRPGTVSAFGACGADGLQGFLAGGGEGVGQREMVGSEATGPKTAGSHRSIANREAVPARCDRQGHVQEGLAGMVDSPRFAPRSQSLGYGLVKTGLADRCDEQDRSCLGDDMAAVVLDAEAG